MCVCGGGVFFLLNVWFVQFGGGVGGGEVEEGGHGESVPMGWGGVERSSS